MAEHWLRVDGVWHLLVRVDKHGWITACGRLVNDYAPARAAHPEERVCPRCHDLYEEPVP